MKGWPIRFTTMKLPINYHGDAPNTVKRNTVAVVRLNGCHVHAWRFYVYGPQGQARSLDIFFPWLRRKGGRF